AGTRPTPPPSADRQLGSSQRYAISWPQFVLSGSAVRAGAAVCCGDRLTSRPKGQGRNHHHFRSWFGTSVGLRNGGSHDWQPARVLLLHEIGKRGWIHSLRVNAFLLQP